MSQQVYSYDQLPNLSAEEINTEIQQTDFIEKFANSPASAATLMFWYQQGCDHDTDGYEWMQAAAEAESID